MGKNKTVKKESDAIKDALNKRNEILNAKSENAGDFKDGYNPFVKEEPEVNPVIVDAPDLKEVKVEVSDKDLKWRDRPYYTDQISSARGDIKFEKYKSYWLNLSNPKELEEYDRLATASRQPLRNFNIESMATYSPDNVPHVFIRTAIYKFSNI